MALVWLFMPQYPIALLPYGIYSIFHVATRTNLIPTIIVPQKISPAAGASPAGASAKAQYTQHPLAETIGNFVTQYYDQSMSMVAFLELILWFRVFCAAILFQRRSWILLVIYTAFVRARFAKSIHVKTQVQVLEARFDNLVGSQGVPPAVRQVWEAVKNGIRQFHDATDLAKKQDGAAPPKKSS
jgi:hypothetical protein